MINEKEITTDIYKISNNVEISFVENMYDMIFILCKKSNTEQIVQTIKNMFDKNTDIEIYENAIIDSDANIINVTVYN